MNHRHLVIVCSCDTVIYDCGCRLRLLEVREAACDACKGVARDLLAWRRSLCDSAYPRAEVGGD